LTFEKCIPTKILCKIYTNVELWQKLTVIDNMTTTNRKVTLFLNSLVLFVLCDGSEEVRIVLAVLVRNRTCKNTLCDHVTASGLFAASPCVVFIYRLPSHSVGLIRLIFKTV